MSFLWRQKIDQLRWKFFTSSLSIQNLSACTVVLCDMTFLIYICTVCAHRTSVFFIFGTAATLLIKPVHLLIFLYSAITVDFIFQSCSDYLSQHLYIGDSGVCSVIFRITNLSYSILFGIHSFSIRIIYGHYFVRFSITRTTGPITR